MGRSKIYVGIAWVCDSTSFSIRVVGSCKIGKVACNPGIDAYSDDEGSEYEVDDKATTIGARSLLN